MDFGAPQDDHRCRLVHVSGTATIVHRQLPILNNSIIEVESCRFVRRLPILRTASRLARKLQGLPNVNMLISRLPYPTLPFALWLSTGPTQDGLLSQCASSTPCLPQMIPSEFARKRVPEMKVPNHANCCEITAFASAASFSPLCLLACLLACGSWPAAS